MNQFETWCEASRAADKDRSRQPGPTINEGGTIHPEEMLKKEERQNARILEQCGGRKVWRVSSTSRRPDGEQRIETNVIFDDGSRGSWMPSPLTPATAPDLLGTEVMESIDDLRAIREHLGWSQAKMAAYAQKPTRTYEDWEGGKHKPPRGLISLIVRLLVAEGVLTQAQVDDIITSK